MMVSFKSFLAAGMMTALLLATVAAAQDEAVPDKYVTDTSEDGDGASKGSLTGPSFPPTDGCGVFMCGSYTKSVWAKTYYSWYASSSLSAGSSTSDGGIVAYSCRRTRWCHNCYRCVVYKWFQTTVKVPSFCCRLPKVFVASDAAARTTVGATP